MIKVLVLLLIASVSYAENRVTVKPVVEVEMSKTDITLSDIVIAKGLSRSALEKFRTIKLSDAPAQGESRVFTSEVVSESIRGDLESVEAELGEHFDIKIPSRVTVTKKKASMSAADLRTQLMAAFKSQCPECEFEISGLVTPNVTKLSEGARWALRTRGELPKGSFSYPIEVSVSDVPVQTYWVSGQLSVRRSVPVAAREIGVGERIQPEDLITQMKDVTFSSDAPIALSDLSSGVTARSISAGQIVFRSALRRELAVKMGDTVKVQSGTDEWQISLAGVSQSSGYIGDSVKVKIPSTSKIVAGILKDKGIVEVIQ